MLSEIPSYGPVVLVARWPYGRRMAGLRVLGARVIILHLNLHRVRGAVSMRAAIYDCDDHEVSRGRSDFLARHSDDSVVVHRCEDEAIVSGHPLLVQEDLVRRDKALLHPLVAV
jgi:hypothetical protein